MERRIKDNHGKVTLIYKRKNSINGWKDLTSLYVFQSVKGALAGHRVTETMNHPRDAIHKTDN